MRLLHPNILLLMVDDMGFNDVGYRNQHILTPYIDALSTKSVHFSQFRTMSWCAPSRYALMTGRTVLPNIDQLSMPNMTLNTVLKERGYKTALIGKNHLPNLIATQWDHFVGFIGGTTPYWSREAWRDNGVAYTRFPKLHTTDVIGLEVIRYMRKVSRPFFLWSSFTAPHVPYDTDPKYMKLYKHDWLGAQKYNALISHVDTVVKYIMNNATQYKTMLQGDLTIFMSDNGGCMVPPSCNGDLRGGKGTIYEGGLRVPFFMHWPGVLPPRTRTDNLFISDFIPLIRAAITGVEWSPPRTRSIVMADEKTQQVGMFWIHRRKMLKLIVTRLNRSHVIEMFDMHTNSLENKGIKPNNSLLKRLYSAISPYRDILMSAGAPEWFKVQVLQSSYQNEEASCKHRVWSKCVKQCATQFFQKAIVNFAW